MRHTFRRGLTPLMLRYPDLIIAFNVNPAEVIARRGYAIDDQGKPPDFVLEIASPSTALNDYTRKRVDYAAYGIPEYWRFGPHGRRSLSLWGWLATGWFDGEYQPITIVKVDDERYWGRSDGLNLDLCWEYGQLRFYDPAAQQYLLTHDDEAEGRITAEARLDAERQARIAAEVDAAEAQARVRQLEEELRRRSQ